MNLPVKIRRDWHYYAFAIGLIFILNGVVGLLGFEAKGWTGTTMRSPLALYSFLMAWWGYWDLNQKVGRPMPSVW